MDTCEAVGWESVLELLKGQRRQNRTAGRVNSYQLTIQSLERAAKASWFDWLEQVVDGADVESRDRMRRVGRTKDDHGPVDREELERLNPAQVGHLDVEEHNVHTSGPYSLENLVAVAFIHAVRRRVQLRRLEHDNNRDDPLRGREFREDEFPELQKVRTAGSEPRG